MIDANEAEKAAMVAAGDAAGQFIEALGRTDMAQWTEQQWTQFIACICGGYVDALLEIQATATTAVQKVHAA